MGTGRKAKGRGARATGKKPKTGGKTASAAYIGGRKPQQTQTTATPTHAATPTYEQIAQRAEHLWRQTGCLPGRDEQNWHEAEAQLKAELAAG